MDDTISETEGAFVRGRQILDVVLMDNELVEDYRSSRRKGMVFKIGFWILFLGRKVLGINRGDGYGDVSLLSLIQ